MRRYYFEVVDVDENTQLVTIYVEYGKDRFVSTYGPFNSHDEDEAFEMVSHALDLEVAGYTYVKLSELVQ